MIVGRQKRIFIGKITRHFDSLEVKSDGTSKPIHSFDWIDVSCQNDHVSPADFKVFRIGLFGDLGATEA